MESVRRAQEGCAQVGIQFTPFRRHPSLSIERNVDSLPGRPNVLIYPEEVLGVVLLLDTGQTIIVVTIAGPNTVLALFHHEVHVGPRKILFNCSRGCAGMS